MRHEKTKPGPRRVESSRVRVYNRFCELDCEHNVANQLQQINHYLSEVFGPLGGWLASIKKALGLQPNGRVEYTDVLRAEGHVEEAEKAGREEAGRSGGHSK